MCAFFTAHRAYAPYAGNVQESLEEIAVDCQNRRVTYAEGSGRVSTEDRAAMVSCGQGTLRISPDMGDVESVANFGTAMATAGVIKGKWMCAHLISCRVPEMHSVQQASCRRGSQPWRCHNMRQRVHRAQHFHLSL